MEYPSRLRHFKLNIPTRVTTHSNTVIDHIFTNILDKFIESGTIDVDISDHKATFVFFENLKLKFKYIHDSHYFNFRKYRYEEFEHKLKEVDWSKITENTEPNPAYDEFCKVFYGLSKCYVDEKSNSKAKKIKKPWVTSALLISINTKYKLYKKTIQAPFNIRLKEKFNRYKNLLRVLLRKAEKNYFYKQFHKYSNNSKNTWKVINEVINKNKGKNTCIPKVVSSMENPILKIEDCKQISNEFNNFFVNVGKNVSKTIRYKGNEPDMYSYLGDRNSNSVFFNPVTKEEVNLLLNHLNTGKAYGVDNLHPRLLRDARDYISEPLSHIYNLCLIKGIVPDQMKIAKIIPIFKGGNPEEVGNYRPVSLLPICSKIFEKLIARRLLEFLEKNNFFYKNQYGFRKNCSTQIAISELVNSIQNEMDRGYVCLAVFLDLKKAFDTVNHKVLLKKLEHVGIRGVAHRLFENYLSDRKQFVKLGNTCSNLEIVKCGVPQGSTLGPLLFLLYVNDMHKAIATGNVRLFADDTCILYSGKNINSLAKIVDKELSVLSGWFKVNVLSINVKKSNYMIIQNSRKKIPNGIQINFDDISLVQCTNCKYLGVLIDNNLTWKYHVRKVCNKISPVIGILTKIRHLMPFSILRQVYFTLINCHVNYCIEAWGTAYSSTLHPLIVLQKKAIRIMTFADYNAHTKELFKILDILPIDKLVFYSICKLVYKEINSLSISNFGFNVKVNHNISTRNANKMKICHHKTNYYCQSINHCGIKFYNLLPNDIINSRSFYLFKNKLLDWIKDTELNLDKLIYPHRYV